MVAASVPVLGRVITINFARSFLNRAADAYQRGDIFGAGVLFREAIRRQLWAECEWHGLLSEEYSVRTPPITLLKAARRGGQCTDDVFEVVKEMIDIGNAAAHCRPVKPSHLHASILVLFDIIDESPYQQPANQQGKYKWQQESLFENADYDDDDCDDEGGAFVKGGAR